MVTDYREHLQTLLPIWEINLKEFTPTILKKFPQPTWRLNPGPAENHSGLACIAQISHRGSRPVLKSKQQSSSKTFFNQLT